MRKDQTAQIASDPHRCLKVKVVFSSKVVLLNFNQFKITVITIIYVVQLM